jgi:hypothetical protein
MCFLCVLCSFLHVNIAEYLKKRAPRYEVNAAFNHARLHFDDGSNLEFEHTSRSNRWARSSAGATIADDICRFMRQFRLNAKHLQIFFEDGSDAEFVTKKDDSIPQS